MVDQQYFQMAVNAARQGADTWTNPQVGAVLVKHDQVLAVGYHHQYGERHAEVDALSKLPEIGQAKGATMYVTLEPCSHYGKTPPCAKRLVEVGISRVIIGQLDPNPKVSGRGVAILEQNGISVTVLESTGGLNQAYNYFYRNGRPWITMKYAMSLDGKINGVSGQRTQLTHSIAQADVQQLRQHQQAILVGERTLTVDDPQLTVRSRRMVFPPIRIAVVHDVNQLSTALHLFDQEAPTWLFSEVANQKVVPKTVKVIVQPKWTPAKIVAYLAEQGIQSLLVEGGSRIQAAFIAAELVDELIVYLSPQVLGGRGLPAAVGLPLTDQMVFATPTVTALGQDVRLRARRL